MSYQMMLSLILLLPLVGAIVNGFFLRRAGRGIVTTVATAFVAIPFLLSCLLVFGPISETGDAVRVNLFPWISLRLIDGSPFVIPFSLVADRLSGILLLIITGVGSLIHIYAGEYMHHEKGVYRFFSYLNLFIFSMLTLVLGSNMLVTFVGWEGVGLCSYLLIGYWYEDVNNAQAGLKAFVVNRVGDLGFLIAMFIAITLFGTLEYADLGLQITRVSPEWFLQNSVSVTALSLCLLVAVTGKSAQFPLYIWLPDAMAGPTPVSALIHAATMVTSGIYLMTRVSFILVHSTTAMFVIALVGAFTALFAATIGLVQNDIKKVLAYSTVSQLGFMVMACGVGAFQYGVAHLTTHAFFKALLFLGAGSVIHALHHEQDIRKMGGLIKKMPITGWTFVVGTLAIIGFPGLSGFFSKDEILYSAWTSGFGMPVFWIMGILASACTSFYMVRLTYLVFFGESRVDTTHADHVRENNFVMTVPLIILAVLAIVGGYIAIPHLFAHHENSITTWLAPVTEQAKNYMDSQAPSTGSETLEWTLMIASTLVMLGSSFFAISLYRRGPQGGDAIATSVGGLYPLLVDKWRIDELYNCVLVKPLRTLGGYFYKYGDEVVIDGTVNDAPKIIQIFTTVLSDAQSGNVRTYMKIGFVGVLALCGLLFLI